MRQLMPASAAAALALALVAPSAVAAPAPPRTAATAAGESYVGELPAGGHVAFVVGKDGRQVKRAFFEYEYACDDGERFSDTDAFRAIPMSATGAFTTSYDSGPIPSPLVPGLTVQFTGTVSGKRNKLRTKIIGTARFTSKVTLPTGQVVNCDSGPLKFKAAD